MPYPQTSLTGGEKTRGRLFGFGRKRCEQMPTAEQTSTAASRQQAPAAGSRRAEEEAERQRRLADAQLSEERAIAVAPRRSKVRKAGTMRRVGNALHLKEWELATDSLPTGDLAGQAFSVKNGYYGEFPLKELHAMAVGHGPNCRCGIV